MRVYFRTWTAILLTTAPRDTGAKEIKMTNATVTVDSVEYVVPQDIASVIATAQADAIGATNQADIAETQGESEIAADWLKKADRANSFTISLISYYFDSVR